MPAVLLRELSSETIPPGLTWAPDPAGAERAECPPVGHPAPLPGTAPQQLAPRGEGQAQRLHDGNGSGRHGDANACCSGSLKFFSAHCTHVTGRSRLRAEPQEHPAPLKYRNILCSHLKNPSPGLQHSTQASSAVIKPPSARCYLATQTHFLARN